MVRREMMYLEDDSSRQLCYAKRRNGLIKKALEMFVLCDVDVAYISLSPSGRLSHFSGDKRIEDVLARFVELPDDIRQFPLPDSEYLKAILNQIKRETEEQIQDQRVFGLKAEIAWLKEEIQKVQADIRKFEPDPEFIMSTDEIEMHEKFLEDTLKRVNERVFEIGESSNARAYEPQPPNAVQFVQEENNDQEQDHEEEENETTGESSSSSDLEDSVESEPDQLINLSDDLDHIVQSEQPVIEMLPQRTTFQCSLASPGTVTTHMLVPQSRRSPSISALPVAPHQPPSPVGEPSQLQAGASQVSNIGQDMNNPIIVDQNQNNITSNYSPFRGAYMPAMVTMPMPGTQSGPRDFMSHLSGNYILPTSNLPSDYRLRSPSPRHQSLRSERSSPYSRPPRANRYPPSNPMTMLDPPAALGAQDYQFQPLWNPMSSGTSSYSPRGPSNEASLISSMPMQQFNTPGLSNLEGYNMPGMHGNISRQFEVGSSSRGKSPIIVEDDHPAPPASNLFGSGFAQSQLNPSQIFTPTPNASTSNPRHIPNSVYDPMYETMGLPVDPHLRMFLARTHDETTGGGNGGL